MWSGDDNLSRNGDAVRLYIPILYGRKKNLRNSSLVTSFIGGGAELLDRPQCGLCAADMHLLVQLHIASNRRTYQVFACNNALCYQKLFQQSPLSYGGGGVISCRSYHASHSFSTMSPRSANASPTIVTESKASVSKWVDDDRSPEEYSNEIDDWGDESTNNEMDDLETKLAAIEASLSADIPAKVAPSPSTIKILRESQTVNAVKNSFPCFELHSLQEPLAFKAGAFDEDDVGINVNDVSDSKIQQMLARYMTEEEDEEILAALAGSADFSRIHSSGGRESDEQLSTEDRALFTYTDRLKRSPRQVLRHAHDGEPLWSIPVFPYDSTAKQPPQTGKRRAFTLPIPPSLSGTPRSFEFQLLPSLLHVLRVDQHSTFSNLDSLFLEGGMNWGNVAVYTVRTSSLAEDKQDDPVEEFVVVQESLEGTLARNRQRASESIDLVVIHDGKDLADDVDSITDYDPEIIPDSSSED